ncbi:MAG TPA: N-acetylmuramoyl-L-alanine amidase [Phycisphaerae bacterium]|nr:N-acetylmuramoyl-L-alanine amidase [Phycisphaerae bacterium]
MAGSRTIKTLTALVISMTIGAFALLLLETAPILPQFQPLAAQASSTTEKIVKDTEVPIKDDTWRSIVLHGPREGIAADNCHFIVDGTSIVATTHWKHQQAADHVVPYVRGSDYNASSIGVFVRSDFSRRMPSPEESEALAQLVTTLQQICNIDRARVYFHCDLYPNPSVPKPQGDFANWLTGRLMTVEQ